MSNIKFFRGNKPADLSTLTEDAIYFFTDTQEIYMQDKLYGVSPAALVETKEACNTYTDDKIAQFKPITDEQIDSLF